MKFNYKVFMKSLIIYIAISLIAIVFAFILGNTILRTLAFAIFGKEHGNIANQIIMRITLFLIIFIIGGIVNRRRVNTSENKKLYLGMQNNQPYALKNDIKLIISESEFFSEFFAMGIVVFVYSLLFQSLWYIFVLPIFALYNGWLYVCIHKFWANNRIHKDK